MDCRQIYHVLTVKYTFRDARTTITLGGNYKKNNRPSFYWIYVDIIHNNVHVLQIKLLTYRE